MVGLQQHQEQYQYPGYGTELHHRDDPHSPFTGQQLYQPASQHVTTSSSTPQDHRGRNDHSRMDERHSSAPPMCIHPERCPPVNLKFLWQIYNSRAEDPSENSDSSRRRIHQERIVILQSQGFPMGLASLMLRHAVDHPLRIFLVDNSGTMHQNDAQLVSQCSSGKVQTVGCTRWEAVTSTIIWHAEMAAWCQTPMVVRLLHDPGISVGPQQVGISASKHYSSSEEMARLKNVLRSARPNGATCLLKLHMQELIPSVSAMVPILRQQERRLTLFICTDSIPTDRVGTENPQMIQDFLITLGRFLDWPVQVVIRLSTKDERVVQFYQKLIVKNGQARQELCPNLGFDDSSNDTGDVTTFREHLQVLDDYITECERVQEHNPWLNYGYPLHLCREEGICINVIEALGQRRLRRNEALDIMGYLFGQNLSDSFPSNESQYHALRQRIDSLNSQSGVLWNPVKKKFVHWIDLKRLEKIYFQQGKAGSRTSSGHKNSTSSRKCAIM